MPPSSPRAKPSLGMEVNKPPTAEGDQSLAPRGAIVVEIDLRVSLGPEADLALAVEAGLLLVIILGSLLEALLHQVRRIGEFVNFIKRASVTSLITAKASVTFGTQALALILRKVIAD